MTFVDATPPPAADVVGAFEDALMATQQSRIDHAELRRLWNRADPGWAATSGARVRLAAALHTLAADGTIELPSRLGRLWDAALPPLPARIAVSGNRRSAPQLLDPATVPWTPPMAWTPSWIRSARPGGHLRTATVRINAWFLSTAGLDVSRVAREERSLHLFDDEKALAHLAVGALFEPGRLTLDALGCDAPGGAVPVRRFADRGPVLVLENKSTFDSACRALAAAPRPVFAVVVFGGGDAVTAMIPDLARLPELLAVRPTIFWYAGDVDIAGVEIAAAFLRGCSAAGLDGRMLLPLWDAVAAAPLTGSDLTGSIAPAAAARLAAHLGLPAGVSERLLAQERVPQERIDRTALVDTAWWVPIDIEPAG